MVQVMFFWMIFIIALALGIWALYLLFRSGQKKPTPIAPPGPPTVSYDVLLIEPGGFHDDERCLSYEERESYNRRWLEERRRRQLEDDVLYSPPLVVVEPSYVPDVTVPDSGGFSGGGDSGGAGASSDWGSSDSGSCDSSSSDSGSCDAGS